MRQGLVIGIDFAKAYDSIHHNYMAVFFLHLALTIPLIVCSYSSSSPHLSLRLGGGW